jgi:hypothetical protein
VLDVVLRALERVYIGVQVLGAKKAILEIRQKIITNHILPIIPIPNISLTVKNLGIPARQAREASTKGRSANRNSMHIASA